MADGVGGLAVRDRAPVHRRSPNLDQPGRDSVAVAPVAALGNQDLLHALGIRAKLTLSQPSDPEEEEADRLADAFVAGVPSPVVPSSAPGSPDLVQRVCASCEEEEETAHRKASGPAPSRLEATTVLPPPAQGNAIPRALRAPYERFFRADFSRIRVHHDSAAHYAAAAINAHAFTRGSNLFFADGRFDPDTSVGRRLLAHELAHTVQRPPPMGSAAIRRQGDTVPPTEAENTAATTIVQGIRAGQLETVVTPLRGRSIGELQSIRELVCSQAGVALEQWLVRQMRDVEDTSLAAALVGGLAGVGVVGSLARHAARGTTVRAEEGLRLIWPVLPLVDRLLVYDEGYREIEQAQIDVIRSATREQRDSARGDPRLERIYGSMDAKEEYDARVMIDPSPEGLVIAANRMLTLEEADPVFDAILALAPATRREWVRIHDGELQKLLLPWRLGQLEIIRSMAREVTVGGRTFGGNEADALIARLRLATESRSDDMAAVQAVVDRAVELFRERKQLRERQQLRALVGTQGLPADERERTELRLRELEGLDRLLKFRREDGELAGGTFMALVAAARDDPTSFAADTQRFAEFMINAEQADTYQFEAAKQRILMTGDDLEGLRQAFFGIHAPPVRPGPGATREETRLAQQEADVAFRRRLLDEDPAVARVVGGLVRSERMMFEHAVTGDAFSEVLWRMNQARRGGSWGEFFNLTLQVARNEGWRYRYEATRSDPWSVYAGVHGEEREIMLEILRSQPPRMPLGRVLRFTGNVAALRAAFAEIPEADRTQLRRGWALARERPQRPLTPEEEQALEAFQTFSSDARSSQTTASMLDSAGYLAVMSAALGTEPSAGELGTPEGRYDAAALMYEQQEGRLALGRGVSQYFTETDETMVAAAREFAALWLRVRDQHRLSMTDYAALFALQQRFLTRAEEFTEASNAIGELAAMIASTVAGVIVVVATGGTATPAVIALAAASGAGARVVTREMFGADYYNSLSSDSARQALLGAIDGALAVVSGRLAAKGAELVGLGGRSLTSGAARVAGVAAEEVTQTMSRRVAAGAVEAAIDGLLSGSITEAFGAFTDERTWRRGIMDGLARVGQAAIVGGLTGMGTGGLIGGAAPLVGAAGSRLWRGIVGDAMERRIAAAGASELLTRARAAAQQGEVGELNSLMRQLESHLDYDQAILLRQQLYGEFRAAVGHPPGTARATGAAQEELLTASGRLDEGLSDAQRAAEVDVVRRSQPQRSSDPGYVDEVDLGNGHTWRRRADGTWCRFTKKTLCGTRIRGVADMPRGTAAQIAAVRSQIAEQAATAEQIARVIENRDEMLARASSGVSSNEPINFKALTEDERAVLDLLSDDPETLTPRALRELFWDPTRSFVNPLDPHGASIKQPTGPSKARALLARTSEEISSSQRRYRELSSTLYDRIRETRPPAEVVARVKRNKVLVEIGLVRPPQSRSVEHVFPVRNIVDLPGFAELAALDFDAARAIAHYEPNLVAMDAGINSARGDRPWSTQFNGREFYSADDIKRMIDLEDKMSADIQKKIDELLKARSAARP